MIGLILQWVGIALICLGAIVMPGNSYYRIFPLGHRCANVVPSFWDAWTTQCYSGRDSRIGCYLLVGFLMLGAGKLIARRAGVD